MINADTRLVHSAILPKDVSESKRLAPDEVDAKRQTSRFT